MKNEFFLRPHHSLCIQFFIGNGYSDEFVKGMEYIKDMLEKENPLLTLTPECDIICKNCPENKNEKCHSHCKVSTIDKNCLIKYNMKFGNKIHWKDLKKLANENIIQKNPISEVCGNCRWQNLCK